MKLLRLWPLMLIGCGELPGQPDPAKKFIAPTKVVDFATLFAKNCAGCHGATGSFGPAPPLDDPIFQTIVTDDELNRVIAQGRKGTSMPAFAEKYGGTLTDQQVQVLIQGMRKEWSKPEKNDWPEYALPKEKGDSKQGLAVFARACADCHGASGQGSDQGGAINDPVFLSLASEQMLRRVIITGRADLGMPNCLEGAGRPLTASEVNDLVALMIWWKNR